MLSAERSLASPSLKSSKNSKNSFSCRILTCRSSSLSQILV